MKSKRIIALLLSLLLILSLVGCGIENAVSGGSDAICWLNYKPELDATLQTLAAKYTEKTGISVKIITPESGTYSRTLQESLDAEDPPTMFVINTPADAEAFGGYAYDLSDTDIQKELDNTPATTVGSIYNAAGKLVGLPYCQECFGIAVNPDLLAPLNYTVEDIKNFDSLKEIAQVIHANASWLGYDAFCSLDLDAVSSWRVTGHLANLEYVYEERDASSWGETPPTLTGAHLPDFKNLYDLIINNGVSAPESLAAGGHNPIEEFTSGKAAFLPAGSWDYATLKAAVPNVTMIPYYCGVKGEEKAGLNCGTENYWAVNVKASDAAQKSTLEFMYWLVTDEEASSALATQLGYLPYKHAAKSDNGFLTLANQYIKEERYTMDWAMKYQPSRDVYRAGLVTALTAYNADQSDKNWEAFKTAFVDDWAKLYVELYNQ